MLRPEIQNLVTRFQNVASLDEQVALSRDSLKLMTTGNVTPEEAKALDRATRSALKKAFAAQRVRETAVLA